MISEEKINRKVSIAISEKDMDAIEDAFFCKLTPKQIKKIHPRLLKIWKQLCEQMEAGHRKNIYG